MEKAKKSGPAILMDWLIAITFIMAVVCFALYYGKIVRNAAVLWTGVVTFTMVYQMKLRLIMGDVVQSLKKHINYNHPWFRERSFEKKLYDALKVKKWKRKVPTFNPELFVLEDNSPEEIATTMAKVEIDHWVNVAISLFMLLFSLVWGAFWAFFIAAVAAILFDAQFIAIQRYNRPRVLCIIERNKRRSR